VSKWIREKKDFSVDYSRNLTKNSRRKQKKRNVVEIITHAANKHRLVLV